MDQQRESTRGKEGKQGGLKLAESESACVRRCVRVSEQVWCVCVKAKQSVAVAEAVQLQLLTSQVKLSSADLYLLVFIS